MLVVLTAHVYITKAVRKIMMDMNCQVVFERPGFFVFWGSVRLEGEWGRRGLTGGNSLEPGKGKCIRLGWGEG